MQAKFDVHSLQWTHAKKTHKHQKTSFIYPIKDCLYCKRPPTPTSWFFAGPSTLFNIQCIVCSWFSQRYNVSLLCFRTLSNSISPCINPAYIFLHWSLLTWPQTSMMISKEPHTPNNTLYVYIHSLQIVKPIYISDWLKSKEAITLSYKQNLESSAHVLHDEETVKQCKCFWKYHVDFLAKTMAKFLQISCGTVGIRALNCHRTRWASISMWIKKQVTS